MQYLSDNDFIQFASAFQMDKEKRERYADFLSIDPDTWNDGITTGYVNSHAPEYESCRDSLFELSIHLQDAYLEQIVELALNKNDSMIDSTKDVVTAGIDVAANNIDFSDFA